MGPSDSLGAPFRCQLATHSDYPDSFPICFAKRKIKSQASKVERLFSDEIAVYTFIAFGIHSIKRLIRMNSLNLNLAIQILYFGKSNRQVRIRLCQSFPTIIQSAQQTSHQLWQPHSSHSFTYLLLFRQFSYLLQWICRRKISLNPLRLTRRLRQSVLGLPLTHPPWSSRLAWISDVDPDYMPWPGPSFQTIIVSRKISFSAVIIHNFLLRSGKFITLDSIVQVL